MFQIQTRKQTQAVLTITTEDEEDGKTSTGKVNIWNS